MSKIAIVGAGNAGCITALELFYLNIEEQEDVITEIEIFHDPDIPIERVGQGNQLSQKTLLFDSLDLNWQSNNMIGATFKSGIRYENWGKRITISSMGLVVVMLLVTTFPAVFFCCFR